MTEKKETVNTRPEVKKERFEFVLTINGNIVCQRYFKINGFKQSSVYSSEFTQTFRHCTQIIKDELSSKSRIYMWYTSPQVFKNKEELDKWVSNQTFTLNVPTMVALSDSDDMYVWNGSSMELYSNYYNRAEFMQDNSDESNITFSFYDNGKLVMAETWDGSVYPVFVRNNIDLTNNKNRYKNPNSWSQYEAVLIDLMIAGRTDIIPQLMGNLCEACSYEDNGD